jgi:hypothetical protein
VTVPLFLHTAPDTAPIHLRHRQDSVSFNTWSRMEIRPTRTLNSQVGGHTGALTTEDGSLLIKAALPRELEIYQKLLYDPVLEALRPFTANFLRTLPSQSSLRNLVSNQAIFLMVSCRFFPVGQAPSSSSGLSKQTLLPILRAIREDVADIREVFTTLEIRMVGGNLFIIYEAD